jgi:uncharacterized protein YeaO (DUF488 family)
MTDVRLKRAYDPPAFNDGYRVLVDRVWPRGVKKEDLRIDDWFKDLAPSKQLREDFGHDPQKWSWFRENYFRELQRDPPGLDQLMDRAGQGRVTLVFGAKDRDHNNAVALKQYILDRVAEV